MFVNCMIVRIISNQIKNPNLFNFTGSKHFFDYLRKCGEGSVDKFMKISEKPSWNKSITLVNIGNRKRQDAFNYEGESFREK